MSSIASSIQPLVRTLHGPVNVTSAGGVVSVGSRTPLVVPGFEQPFFRVFLFDLWVVHLKVRYDKVEKSTRLETLSNWRVLAGYERLRRKKHFQISFAVPI